MTTGLHELQRQFAAALDPRADPELQAQVHATIRPGASLDARESLAVYGNNVFGAHHHALQQIFPVCEQILGDKPFVRMARQYLWAYPSPSPDLNLYGQEFPAYLSDKMHSQPGGDQYAYLGDLAQLEWGWHALYYRPAVGPFPFERLAGLSEQDQGRVCLQPSAEVEWMASSYPVREIWQRHRQGEVVNEIAPLEQEEYLLVQRIENKPNFRTIDAQHYALLQACKAGKSLADIAAERGQALACLPEALEQGWISGFRLLGQA